MKAALPPLQLKVDLATIDKVIVLFHLRMVAVGRKHGVLLAHLLFLPALVSDVQDRVVGSPKLVIGGIGLKCFEMLVRNSPKKDSPLTCGDVVPAMSCSFTAHTDLGKCLDNHHPIGATKYAYYTSSTARRWRKFPK